MLDQTALMLQRDLEGSLILTLFAIMNKISPQKLMVTFYRKVNENKTDPLGAHFQIIYDKK